MKEKPIGLIVGLLFIIGFGLLLGLVMNPEDNVPPGSKAVEQRDDSYAISPPINDSSRYTPVVPGHDSGQASGSAAADDSRLVDVRILRPQGDDRAGTVTSEYGTGLALSATGGSNTRPAGGSVTGGAVPIGSGNAGAVDTHSGGGEVHRTFMGPGGMTTEMPSGAELVAQANSKTYTVVAGDNLTRIAEKFYGPTNGRKYKLIYEANRDSMRSESDLSIGQELVIPPLEQPAPAPTAGSASVPTHVATGPPPAGRSGPALTVVRDGGRRYAVAGVDDLRGALHAMGGGQTPVPVPAPAPTRAGRTYVTQRGDTLTAVARRMMHSSSRAAVRKLFEANRGVLSSPNRVPIGVELRIP